MIAPIELTHRTEDTIPSFELAHVFCHPDIGRSGNPTGLVLNAAGMTPAEMQEITARCGHESGFVLPPSSPEADFRFRFFVPRHEMEMCGHATVGALWLLRARGHIDDGVYRIETESGPVIGHVGERVEITQPLGTTEPRDDKRDAILSVLGLAASDLADLPIENATTSRTKTLVPLSSAHTLNAITPDFDRMEALCEELGSTGLYPYAMISMTAGQYEARQFPKNAGYPEDAATGVAATALASALFEKDMIAAPSAGITIFQGRAMGNPSQIQVRFAKNQETGVIDQCLLSGLVCVW